MIKVDIISYAKNVAALLATASTLAYLCGYLVLRARANALGIDPAFTLVDEAYVFAGFRFVFISLVILLLLSPVILAVSSGSVWLQGHISGPLLNTVQWLLLVLLALLTLLMTVKVLSVNGVLLQPKFTGQNSLFQESVMGGTFAVVLMFAMLLLTVLSVLWLKMRLATPGDPFVWVLLLIVSIQLFLLPIFHGVLYADRNVRVLGSIPAVVHGINEPLGIVARTSEHVTLLGLDDNEQRRLVSIKLDELNGISVKKIIRLKEFVEIDLLRAEGKGESVMPEKRHTDNTIASTEVKVEKGFFEVLINYLQFTFEAIGSLGESNLDYGQIWSVELDASGMPAKPTQISTQGNYSWPVPASIPASIPGSSGETVYAIHQEQIIQLTDNGQSFKTINKQKQWIKLFGVAENGAVLGMIYENGDSKLAMLQADGTLTLSTTKLLDEEEIYNMALMQESRSYAGNRSLYVERSKRGGRGFDVFFKFKEQVYNLSDCGDDHCGQASLSANFRRALYIRKARY